MVHVGLLLIKMEWCTSVTLATTEFRNSHRGGSFLAYFDHKKLRHSFSPYGLCFDSNNLLYATDMQNSVVCVFNTSGKFLGYIGTSDGSSFVQPRLIVSDKDRLYISDDNGVVTNKCFQQ